MRESGISDGRACGGESHGTFRGRWLRRFVAMGLGFLLAIAVAEVVLRVISRGATVDRWAIPNTRYGFLHRTNFKQTVVRPWVNTTYVWHVSINSLGFRGPEPNLQDTNAVRILLLGDSFTFGYGVEYEQTFGALLQQKLLDAGITSIVFNAGVTGWGSAQQFLFAVDHFERLKPDIIIVTFCENDPMEDEIFARGGAAGILPRFPGKRWLRDHLRVYSVVYTAASGLLYNRYVLRRHTASNQRSAPPDIPIKTVSVDRFGSVEWGNRTMELYRVFAEKFRKFNPNGCIVVQLAEFWRNDFRDVMTVLATEGYIRFVDLRDVVGDMNPDQTKLPFDPHWNPEMHALSGYRLAEEVLKCLRNRV